MMDRDYQETYHNRRERKAASAAVYVVCGWIGLLGGVVGYWIIYWIMRVVAG